MIKTGRIVLRVVFVGFILLFLIAKLFEFQPRGEREKRIRHVDNTARELDELW